MTNEELQKELDIQLKLNTTYEVALIRRQSEIIRLNEKIRKGIIALITSE